MTRVAAHGCVRDDVLGRISLSPAEVDMHRWSRFLLASGCLFAMSAVTASAQTLGTFRWQLQPYCNVLTLTVVQSGANFRLEGIDNLCDGSTRASAIGMAYPKPDGTIGFGITIVTDPGAAPLHLTASVSLATISGTWLDSAGNAGAFVFNPSIAPGSPRPPSKPIFAAGLSAGGSVISSVGTPATANDAANKAYVDSAVVAPSAREGWLNVNSNATLRSASANLTGTTVVRAPGFPVGYYCIVFPPGTGFQTEAAVGSVQQLFGGDGEPSRLTVTRTFGSGCNPTGFSVAVQTYSAAGALADRPFILVIPR
jgi:hypothetical protein